MMDSPVIGLFGTCGGSKWRDAFIEKYEIHGINYFNPNKADWSPNDAFVEAEHLATDDIVLIAITNETYGSASLAETAYAIMNATSSTKQRYVVIYIDPSIQDTLVMTNPTSAKESRNARSIVLAHLGKMDNKNVFVVDSLDKMYDVSMRLGCVLGSLNGIRSIIEDGA